MPEPPKSAEPMLMSRKFWLSALMLMILTLAAYLPVWSNDFVNFDDGGYIYDNPSLDGRLSLGDFRWAFTSFHAANWHPLTWVSLSIDRAVFGLDPRGFHGMNLLLHLGASLLLMAVLGFWTGSSGAAFFYAAVFALHPVHVESVAWASERKDVLCALFFIGALYRYHRYTQHPSGKNYAAVMTLFLCALLSKPMAVTLPFLLLFLDFWPYQRIRRKAWLEKMPMIFCSLGSGVLTMLAQRNAVAPVQVLPMGERVTNAIHSYGIYLQKFFWPSRLCIFYPHPRKELILVIVSSLAAVFFLVLFLAVMFRKKAPAFLVGWLWFLTSLLPVIGLIQVGSQGMADRYLYLPSIGIMLMVWEMTRRFFASQIFRMIGILTVSAVLYIYTILTFQQVGYWKNTETLFAHAIDAMPNNYFAYASLGNALSKRDDFKKAIEQYLKGLEIKPGYKSIYYNLGFSFNKLNMIDEATKAYEIAIQLDPEDAEAMNNLGNIYLRKSNWGTAFHYYEKAIQVNPKLPQAYFNRGIVYEKLGKNDSALGSYREAIRLRPDYPDAVKALEALSGGDGIYQ